MRRSAKLFVLCVLALSSCSKRDELLFPEEYAPNQPNTLTAASATRSGVYLQWQPSPMQPTSYRVYRLDRGMIGETDRTRFIDFEIQCQHVYTYWVTEVSFSGERSRTRDLVVLVECSEP